LRSKSRWASVQVALRARHLGAAGRGIGLGVSTAARAASTSAWAWRTRYSKVSGSICAISWPALTSELKSTYRSLIWPDTWVPTDTCVTGLTAPLADTVACSGPRSILPVRYCTASACLRCSHHQAPPPASASHHHRQPIQLLFSSTHCRKGLPPACEPFPL
jgi:hypothetical protein